MDALLYKTDCLLVREEFEIVSGHQPQNACNTPLFMRISDPFSGAVAFRNSPVDIFADARSIYGLCPFDISAGADSI